MNKMNVAAITALACTFGSNAQAELVDEVRFGALQHNICVTDCKNADKEDGPNVQAELVFGEPEIFKWILSPSPYLVASINTAGNTSFGGFGLNWDFGLTDRLDFDLGLGYVIHDGETKNPFPDGSPEAFAFSEENVLLGSEDLFRTTFGLTYELNEKWGVQAIFEHLSHGQILGNGRNQGMDSAGVRVIYDF